MPKFEKNTPTERDVRDSLLNLISLTTSLALVKNFCTYSLSATPPFISPRLLYENSRLAIATGRLLINQELHATGGIAHYTTDKTTGERVECVLRSLVGIEASDPPILHWRISSSIGDVLSVNTSILDELREANQLDNPA